MRISVIIPAYNEEENIIATLDEVVDYLKNKFSDDWEIIVADDKSNDNTYFLVQEYMKAKTHIKLIQNSKNMGKGYSVRAGVQKAEGEYILFMDADNSTKINEFDKMMPLFDKNEADIVIASRKLEDSKITVRQPLLRRTMSFFHHWLVKILLGVKASDYNCGFKAFRKQAAKLLFSKQTIKRWVFDAEVLFIAKKYNFRIKEIPIRWQHKHTSKVIPFRAIFSSLKELPSIIINNAKGLY